jgi:hypothetical protein
MFVYGKFCFGIWSFNDSSRILKRIYIGLRYENGLLVGVLCVRSYIGRFGFNLMKDGQDF